MIVYDKLVRDRIPEILTGKGIGHRIRFLHDDERYRQACVDKVAEEAAEVARAAAEGEDVLGECADLVEIAYALAAAHGHNAAALDAARSTKAASRGAFVRRVFLVSTDR